MHLKTLFTLLTCSLLLFSCGLGDDVVDETGFPTVLGSAIFTVVNCTDTSADPTCTTTFDLLADSQIFLYTSAEDREFNDPIHAQSVTGDEGTAEFPSLEGGDYFYIVQYPTDATVIQESSFSIANGSRSQVRIEFAEE